MNKKVGMFVTKRPVATLVIILGITFLMMAIDSNPGAFGLEKNEKGDESDFLPDNDIVIAFEEIEDRYGVSRGNIILLVESRDGNILTREALMEMLTVEKSIAGNQKVREVLFPQQPNILSLPASIASAALMESGVERGNITYDLMLETLENMTWDEIEEIILQAMDDPETAAGVAMFLTRDFPENLARNRTRAEASMIILWTNSTLYELIEEAGENSFLDADHEILSIIETAEFSHVRRMGLIENEYVNERIEEDTGGVMERLFLFVFLLIIGILLLTYRSFFDTIISLLALVFAISWMNGMGVILGLSFTSMYQAVPILLLGLGIDYAIHLVMRYREERTHFGKNVGDSLMLSTMSVGAALFLATVTTGLSFGSNTVSEIKPMREFSIFALIGIVSAFIIMITFVPAAKMIYHSSIEPKIDGMIGKVTRRNHPGAASGSTDAQRSRSGVAAGGVRTFGRGHPGDEPERSIRANESGTVGLFSGSPPRGSGNPGSAEKGDHGGGHGKPTRENESGTATMLSRFLARGAVAAEKHSGPVIIGVVIISVICAILASQLETKFDYMEFLPEGSQISDDIVYLNNEFVFGYEESNVLVRGRVDDPKVLTAMNETQTNLGRGRNVNEGDAIASILTLMARVADGSDDSIEANATFAAMYHAADTDGDGIPDRDIRALFDFLMDHEVYRDQAMRVLYRDPDTGDYEGAVIRVAVNSQNGAKNREIHEDMKGGITPLRRLVGREDAGDGVMVDSVVVTGGPVLVDEVINSIQISGYKSLIITVLVAGVILTAVFYYTDRSLALGILTEIPVILVITWVFASMYVIGMDLNVMTIMIASLTVGLGITYGIHVTHRFVEDLAFLGDIDRACTSTVMNTGAALFGAAVTTIGGFGILVFAPIPPMKKFGAISALSIGFSLIASVYVLPVLLSVWAKYVKRKDPCFFSHHADVQREIATSVLTCSDGDGHGTRRSTSVTPPSGERTEPVAGEVRPPGETGTPEKTDAPEKPHEAVPREPHETKDRGVSPERTEARENPHETAPRDSQETKDGVASPERTETP